LAHVEKKSFISYTRFISDTLVAFAQLSNKRLSLLCSSPEEEVIRVVALLRAEGG